MNNITLYNKDCLECISQLETNSIDFIYFNPPYGTTECDYDKPLPWPELWPEIWRVLKPKGTVAIHASIPFNYKLASTQYKHLKYNWYWDKMCGPTGHLFASRQPMRVMEEVLIFYKKLGTYNPQMILKDKELFKPSHEVVQSHYYDQKRKPAKLEKKTYTHSYPTHLIKMKRRYHPFSTRPIELCEYFIKTYSNENDTILDLTCSDGQSALACKNLNRKYIGNDIDKSMIELVKERLKDSNH